MYMSILFIWIAVRTTGALIDSGAVFSAAIACYLFCHAFVSVTAYFLIQDNEDEDITSWSAILNPLRAIKTINRLLHIENEQKTS